MKKNKLDIADFVKRARLIHGNKYDYGETKYINYDTKLMIKCTEHGYFWQTPGNHLKGKGCPMCSGNKKMDADEFIKRSKLIWGEKFNYDKVIYVNNSTKVCLINNADGKEYFQTPANNLFGFDCTNNIPVSMDEFKEKAAIIHKNKYIYDKSIYTNAKTKICITCPEHGDFYQTLYNHLVKMQGCPECKKFSVLEKLVEEILINNSIDFVKQKHFKWLSRKSLDFFIPDFNIAIECQGKQHLYDTGRFENFDVLTKRDFDKYNLCQENGIKIIYVLPELKCEIIDFYNDKITCRVNNLIETIKTEKEKD